MCCRSSKGWRRASASRSPSTPTRRRPPTLRSRAGAAIVNDVSGLRYDPALADVVAQARRADRADAHARSVAGHVPAGVLPRRRRRGPRRAAREHGVCGRRRHSPRPHHRRSRARLCEGGARTATRCWPARASSPSSVGRCSSARRESRFSRSRSAARCRRRARLGHRRGGRPPRCLAGAHIVRVHAVREMLQVVRVADEIRRYHANRLMDLAD